MPYVSPYRGRQQPQRSPHPQPLYQPPQNDKKPRWNNHPQFQKRRRIAALVTGVLLVILILVIGLAVHVNKDTDPTVPEPVIPEQGQQRTPKTTTEPSNPEALAPPQLAKIPQTPVLVIAVPGTWEVTASSNPGQPVGLLKPVLTSVKKKNGANVGTYTLPYPAQFRNLKNRTDMTYNDSRSAGVTRLLQTLETYLSNVPNGKVIIIGFSQGAVVVGDTLTAIGNNNTSISPYSIAGGILVADGRRETKYGITPGSKHLAQNGLEVELAHIDNVESTIMKGTDAVMTGPRGEGFGVLRSRVTHICRPGDIICDAPHMSTVKDALTKTGDIIAGYKKHAEYGHVHLKNLGGLTAVQWMILRTDKLVKISLAS